MNGWLTWLGDVVAILGTAAMTLAIAGMIRIPDAYGKMHAAAKGVALGVFIVLLAPLATGDLAIITRGLLVGGFLLLTAPVAAHAVAHLAWHTRDAESSDAPSDGDGKGTEMP